MPILMGASARAEMMKGAANWARPATAPALTKVRRSRAREPRRLSICPSLRVASQWAILIDDLGLAAQGPTRGWGEQAQPATHRSRQPGRSGSLRSSRLIRCPRHQGSSATTKTMGIVTVAALVANVDTGANAAITVRCTVPRRLPRDGEGLGRHHVMSQLVHYEARA